LLGNAVKFTEKGEVRIRAWRDEVTVEARVVIEDTGVGIAPEHQTRLFKKFSQVDSSYRRRHSGTGLGLVITQALIKNMGGTIRVESEGIDQGTRVSLGFPALIGSRDEVP
jgi:signal transduction histidine kinase